MRRRPCNLHKDREARGLNGHTGRGVTRVVRGQAIVKSSTARWTHPPLFRRCSPLLLSAATSEQRRAEEASLAAIQLPSKSTSEPKLRAASEREGVIN